MAAAATVEYAGRAVYGSEAYDLDRVTAAMPLPEEEYAPQPTPEELQRERIRERLREREQARANERAKAQTFGIPVLGIIGAIAAVVLMISVLMGFVELAAISGETSQVRSSIAALEDKNEALRIKYESVFDLDEIEAYAINILGMTRPEDGGNVYYSVYMSDRAEILAEDETAGFLARVVGFLKEIPEYFK